MEKERISDILLLCVAAIWGINFVAMKFLLVHISPVNLVLVRFFIGSILLFFLLLFSGDVKVPLRDFIYLCFLGVIGITMYQFFFTYALKYASVTNVSIIINSAPLYGGILSSFFGFEKFNKKKILCILPGFFGVFIIVTKGTFSLESGNATGNILAVVSSVLWALYTILSKPFLDRHSPLKVTTYSTITGSVLLIPFAPFCLDLNELMILSAAGWAIMSFTVVFSIVIAFYLWYRGVKKIGPSQTIIYQYSIPVFAAFFAYLLIHEQLYFSQLMGASIVFLSLWLARRS
ncbi:MAG TPA: DMT family transporter [Syntrophorhabdus sp.]|nr:DMT family transporter [Syntrophorhabdus sp.]